MQKMKSFFYQKDCLQFRLAAIALAAVLFVMLLVQVVFAENTFVITDGDRVLVHTTTASDPALVLNEAGFALGADDTYTTQPGLGVSEITVMRVQNITVVVGQETKTVQSYGETVQQLLQRMDISVDEDLVVSAALSDRTRDGMTIRVNDRKTVTQKYVQEIPYHTTYCSDPSLPEGQKRVLTAGVVGQMEVTTKVTLVDGKEVSREQVGEKVLNAPVDAVVAVGTANPDLGQLVIGDGYIITPEGELLHYTSSAVFEATAYSHNDEGCDFVTATGTQVRIGTVAVDPTVIPYGTRFYIVSNDGKFIYGVGTAEDCGGAIEGKRLDLYYPTYSQCMMFGRRDVTIYFLTD